MANSSNPKNAHHQATSHQLVYRLPQKDAKQLGGQDFVTSYLAIFKYVQDMSIYFYDFYMFKNWWLQYLPWKYLYISILYMCIYILVIHIVYRWEIDGRNRANGPSISTQFYLDLVAPTSPVAQLPPQWRSAPSLSTPVPMSPGPEKRESHGVQQKEGLKP